MTSEELFKLLTMIKAAYGQKFQQIDNNVLEVWFECLGGYQYDRMRSAILLFCQRSPFPPTIAELIDEYGKVDSRELQEQWQA